MRKAILLALLIVQLLGAAVPAPREHFGFTPGDDYKLAGYNQIISYFQKLDHSSTQLKLVEFGKTSLGKPMYAAFISAAENLKKLDEYREINRKLALGLVSETEAKKLSENGKVIVWIDSGLHATEVAPSQHAPELAYQLLTSESAETKRILQQVILIQIPCINPDGLDMVAEWYRQNVGTPYELAPLPRLYQKYSGHDNNRDWFMLNLPETRHVTKLLFQEWFPEIVYNQHQAPTFPARIFIPPYAEPLNPNIPSAVVEGINQIGAAIKERLAREDKPGAISYFGFDGWWNGGLRSVPAFHNMHGILTETAASGYATPKAYDPSEFKNNFPNGIPTKEPTIFYTKPWMGGQWRLRDAIEYMLTADYAILNLAAFRSQEFLYKSYTTARSQIEQGRAGKPFAYVIPDRQWDSSSAREMLQRLQLSGIEIKRSQTSFSVNGKQYPEGTFVIPTAQPFRSYLVDLMEPQKYPKLTAGTNSPTKRPYDVTGWTLPMQMGVEVNRVDQPFETKLETVSQVSLLPSAKDHRDTSFFENVASLLKQGRPVHWDSNGDFLDEGENKNASYTIQKPRVAIYDSWSANSDAGWTDWLLDRYRIDHTMLQNAELQKGNLRAQFDAIILPSQSAQAIVHGIRNTRARQAEKSEQRAEYIGGIELSGLVQLAEFVQQGGWLITFDQSSEVPVRHFPLPVQLLLRESSNSPDSYYCPGSILRMTVDTKNPIAFGMPQEAYAFVSGGQAFEDLLPKETRSARAMNVIARFAQKDVLASGWLSGEKTVTGKPILVEAHHGKGRVIMFGFRPQFRGQSFGTFRLVLNAVYLASAKVNN